MLLKLITYYHYKDIPTDLPGTNVFYSREMFYNYEMTPDYTPILLVAFDDMRPMGKILLTIYKSFHFFPPSIMNHSFVYGTGEYFNEQDDDVEFVFGKMLDYLTELALSFTPLVYFRNLENQLFGFKAFRKMEYFPIKWMRTINNLSTEKVINGGLSASRKRQIRLGLKNGAHVYNAVSEEDVRDFSQMLQKVYPYKIRKHFPSLQFLHRVSDKDFDKNLGNVFIVRYKQKVIGGAVVVYSDRKAYMAFCGGMNRLYNSQYPGVLAVWAAIQEAHSRGYVSLEYMDAGLPFRHNGFRDFVGRFGARNESSRRWYCFRNGFLNKIFIKLYV